MPKEQPEHNTNTWPPPAGAFSCSLHVFKVQPRLVDPQVRQEDFGWLCENSSQVDVLNKYEHLES